MGDNLVRGLHASSVRAPHGLALSVGGREFSYGDLARVGRTVASWLSSVGAGRAARVGVLAGRSFGAYAGVIGACWGGATYVPLGLNWGEQRLIAILSRIRLDALIVDADAARRLSRHLLARCPAAILLADDIGVGSARFQILNALADAPDREPVPLSDDHVAYIIYTSGTTGAPKGVEVSLGAIAGHLADIQQVYGFVETDRVSLVPELTFDPSILNMFMTWNVGASLHVLPNHQLISPIEFINDHALTIWNSTPTVVGLMMRLGLLEPGILPGLRVSIFGGDTLTVEAAAAWRRAAPSSVIDNVYGPTEATIECLHQRFTDPPVATPDRGSIALGRPYPGNEVAVFDAQSNLVPAGEIGELAISGPHLAIGYLDEPELTAARFPTIAGKRWYLTGDLACQDEQGRFHHLGRRDDQVKVRGHRVELGDVESHLREVCGTQLAAAVAWPISNGAAVGIVAFVAGPARLAASGVRAELERRLPIYMAPREIREVADLPFTSHGKIDRRALLALLEAEQAGELAARGRLAPV